MKSESLALALSLAVCAPVVGASSPVVVDSTGAVLGFFTGDGDSGNVRVVSSRGFAVEYQIGAGTLVSGFRDPWGVNSSPNTLFYQTADCTGTPYFEYANGHRGGTVGRASASGLVYYIPKNAPAVNFTSLSQKQGNSPCDPGTFFPGPFVEALLNDPGVTGVSNDPAIGPLRIEVATIEGSSFDVFKDGFEMTAARA